MSQPFRFELVGAWMCAMLTSLFLTLGSDRAGFAQEAAEPEPQVKYRQVYVPRRDVARLIPPDYEPISAAKFKAGLSDLHGTPELSEELPILTDVVLMARYSDGALQSVGSSYFSFSYAGDAPGELVIEPLNLALLPTITLDRSSGKQLSSDFNGDVTARVSGDQSIEFNWTLKALQTQSDDAEFVLKTPVTGNGVLYLVLSSGLSLQCDQGIVQELSVSQSPTDDLELREDETLYRIEFAGDDTIRLRVAELESTREMDSVVMRDAYGSYLLRDGVVEWSVSFDFTWSAENGSLQLQLPPKSVVSELTVDGTPQSIETRSHTDAGVVWLTPELLQSSGHSRDHRLQMKGISKALNMGWTKLPKVYWKNAHSVSSGSGATIQLQVESPLELMDVENASEWKIANASVIGSTESYQFSGSRWEAPLPIYLKRDGAKANAINGLKLLIGNDMLTAHWASVVQVGTPQQTIDANPSTGSSSVIVGPLVLEIQAGWEVTSAEVLPSNRELEVLTGKPNRVLIWPESGEMKDNQLALRIKGRRALPRDAQVSIPPVYFARWQRLPSETYAMLTASSRLRFRSNYAMQQMRISENQLQPEVAEMFRPLANAHYLMKLEDGQTPVIDFDRPTSRFDARLDVDVAFRNGKITEQFTLGIENISGKLERLDVRFPNQSQEPIRWVIFDHDSVGNDLSRRGVIGAVRETTEDGADIWHLDCRDHVDDGLLIVGTRVLDARQWEVDLPGVPLALNQRGTVRLDDSMQLVSISPNVVRIPEPKRSLQPISRPVLRYDPTVDGQVLVKVATDQPVLPIISSSTVSVMADVTGTERVFVELHTDSSGTIHLDHDPDLVLERVVGDVQGVAPKVLSTPSGSVAVELGRQRSLLIILAANRKSHFWGRMLQAPQINFRNSLLHCNLAMFVKPTCRIVYPSALLWVASSDAAIATPQYVVESVPEYQYVSGISWGWNQRAVLIGTETIFAAGIALGLVLFAIGWAAASWTPSPVLGLSLALTLAAACSWRWEAAWYLLALAPFSIGALVANFIGKQTPQESAPSVSSLSKRSSLVRNLILLISAAVLATSAAGQSQPSDSAVPQNITNRAQTPLAGEASPRQPTPRRQTHTLLIPVDDQGKASENIYIPAELYQRLTRQYDNPSQFSAPRISSARYIVDIRAGAFIDDRDTTRIQATLGIENLDASAEVVLPIEQPAFRKAIRRIDLLVGGEVVPIRLPPVGEPILLPLSGQVSATVRFLLAVPTIAENSGIRAVKVAIPPVINAQTTVNYDEQSRDIEIVTSRGMINRNVSARSVSADLGPSEELHVVWNKQNADTSEPLVITGRTWYLQLGDDQVSREVQLEFARPSGSTTKRIELNVDNTARPIITSSDWKLLNHRILEGQRSALTFESDAETLRPLRLLWTAARDSDDAQTLRLVDVRSAITSKQPSEVLVALAAPDGWTVEDPFETLATPVDANAFFAAWKLRVAKLSAVYRSEYKGPIPFRLRRDRLNRPQASDLHQITLNADRMEIDYKLSVQEYRSQGESLRIQIPKQLQISRVLLQGNESPYKRLPLDDYDDLVLRPNASDNGFVEVYIKATTPLSPGQAVDIPRIFPRGLMIANSQYQWSRCTGVMAQWVGQRVFEDLSFEVPGVEQLAAQMFPLTRWDLTGQWLESPQLPGQVRVRKAIPRLDSQSVTVVSWENRSWAARTYFDISVKQGNVDYFSFEVPNSWFAEVTVDGNLPLITTPSVNRESKIVMVIPERQTANRYRITLRGAARSTASESVSVPNVRLLQAGSHRHFFAVPRRLTNEAIAWKVTAANEAALQKPLARAAAIPDDYLVYAATPNFSASLSPVLDLTIEPSVSLVTFDYFQTHRAAHLRGRWDFIPAGRDSLKLKIPDGYKIVSARINNMNTELVSLDSGNIAVELLYSQLPQQVELLLEIPTAAHDASGKIALPQAVDVPVEQSWFAMQTDASWRLVSQTPPQGESHDQRKVAWSEQDESQMLLAQANAIIACFDAATESLQERTSYELVHWLTPWVVRFDHLCSRLDSAPSVDKQTVEQLRDRIGTLLEQTGVENLVRQAIIAMKAQRRISNVPIAVYQAQGGTPTVQIEQSHRSASVLNPHLIVGIVLFAGLYALTWLIVRVLRLDGTLYRVVVWTSILCLVSFFLLPPSLTVLGGSALAVLVLSVAAQSLRVYRQSVKSPR